MLSRRGHGERSRTPAGLALVIALAVALVTVTWGPVVPTARGQDTPGGEEVVGVGEPPWRAWRTEQVDDRGVRPADVAFNSQGAPHVFYLDPDAGVTVASPTLTGWEQDFVSSAGWPGDVAVDGEDTVWVSYVRSSTDQVYVANKPAEAEAWSITAVSDARVQDPPLALNDSGDPHLLYQTREEDTYYLTHAYRGPNGGYVTEDVLTDDSGGLNLDDIALAAGPDPGDGLHAVFRQLKPGDYYQARYAEYDPATGGWSFTWLGECNPFQIDLAVDTDNTPHVACKGDNGGLVHYERVDGAWESSLAADGGDAVPPRSDTRMADHAAIAVQDGTVHMAWRTPSDPFFSDNPFKPMHLYYTSRVDGAYTTEHADASGTGVGGNPSISVCPDGTPWIAYEYRWRLWNAPGLDRVNPSGALHLATPVVGAGSMACSSQLPSG